MKKTKGISLIVLVITIIVIIILAGAVILSLSNNNPISQANEATFKESVQAFNSELDMYYSSQYASSIGQYNPELLEANATSVTYNGAPVAGKTNIYSIISSMKSDGEYADRFVIKKGRLLFKGTDTNQQDWTEEIALESLYRPALYVIADPALNKVHLRWNMNDATQPYTYKVYQRKEGSSDFQSISTNNLKSNVKVLNVYPNVPTMITYTTSNGVTRTIPKSASLEMWMEQANIENSNGYGMGLIDVDPVDFANFNSDPNSYLVGADGKWKYDVVFYGSWDSNGSVGDMSAVAAETIKRFISSGRGILFGHDTIGTGRANFASMRTSMNIRLGTAGFDYPTSTVPWVASDQVSIRKKGLLTNYPWAIGDINTVLNIPYAHSTGQVAFGDVWMDFYLPHGGHNQGPAFHDPVTGEGTSNFYLTTWNNTAMIQTGHSSGEATADEQKVIANTLFYLAQLTSETYLDDNSGQDLKAPTDPVISQAKINSSTGKVDITLTSAVDQGSTYSYYVEALGQNASTNVKTGVKSTTITSGLAGYSVIVDTITNTIPTNTVNVTTTNVSITKPAGTDIYVHIKAIDNRGNFSNTVHLKAS